MPSSVKILVPSYGFTYTFCGVLSVKHELSLKIRTDQESAYGTDYVNGARNQPDRVILTVLESDVGHPAGRADRMLQALENLKRTRTLCTVVTSARTYAGMLLSEISAAADETSCSGWQGTLAFTQAEASGDAKTNDNASAAVNTGPAAPARTLSETQLRQLLLRAGIELV